MIDQKELRELLHFDRESGIFRWRSAKKYGLIPPWSVAGYPRDGYVSIQIGRHAYQAHRLAWLYEFGEWPSGDIDHINGIRNDNRIANLRDVPRQVNAQNRRAAGSYSSTGLLGASPHGDTGRFVSGIGVNGRRKHLGVFDTAEEAHAAYIRAKRELHEGCTI